MLLDIPDAVITFCANAGLGEPISATKLTGGFVNQTQRIETTSGRCLILKQNSAEGLERLFECEADGLRTLRDAGTRTPEVHAVGLDFLLLEDLGVPATEPDWAAFGRAIAQQHQHTHVRYGFAYDNYLGPLPQINTWSANGHEFFGQQRVLRYLSEPKCDQALTTQDRQALERLVRRLPELVPVQPPALLHGDLWQTNMLVDALGQPAVIDPAVYYGWPEADLSMTRQMGNVPAAFFDAYNEINPLAPGWWDRLELLMIRQHMAVLAFFGNEFKTLAELRAVLAKYQ